MAQIIVFGKENISCDNIESVEDDFTKLFKNATIDKQKYDKFANIIAKSEEEIAECCRVAMNTLLLKERAIESALFRCVIHASRVIARASTETPESYWASDYAVKAMEENKPSLLCEGADMCYLLCAFFPEHANRRAMMVKDYENMGTQMYYRYYAKTKNTLGLCMGDNFRTMIILAQECITEI